MEYKIFGCRLNKFYANQWINYFEDTNQYNKNSFLIASCEVTDKAKSKRIKEIKKLIRNGYTIYLTGCGSLDKGTLIDKEKFYERYQELKDFSENIVLLPESPNGGNKNYIGGENNIFTRKYVVIQNGCDTHCTFCLTVLNRGPNRNRDLEDIINEIHQAENSGAKEIVLTGINLSAWGTSNTRRPEESKFSYLLEQILKRTNIPRIRISSLSPEFLDERFFELAKNKRILPFFHFSIQHFSDKILKSMNRNYKKDRLEYVLDKIYNLKRDDGLPINIGGDIIIGFPKETEEDFLETFEGIKRYNITNLHAFPFSGHTRGQSVPAGKFRGQVPQEVKKERERQIFDLNNRIKKDFWNKNKGKKQNVLIEYKKGDYRTGWSENYVQYFLKGNYNKGEIVEYTP